MKRMEETILADVFALPRAAVSAETNLNNLKIIDLKRDALPTAVRAIFVPTISDWSALNLPPRLHSLYYAYRPFRLSKIYSTSIWRKLGSKGAA